MTTRNVGGTAVAMITALGIVFCQSLAAQEAGNRVRVTIGGEILTGDVVETSDGGFTLSLMQDDSLRAVSNTEIEALEIRTCCIDYAWAYPTVAGVLVGGLLGAYATDGVVCSETSFLGLFEDDSCDIQGNGFWWGILGGGVVGVVVAKTVFRENWETIPIPGRSGPSLSPMVDIGSDRNGNAAMILGVRIRF